MRETKYICDLCGKEMNSSNCLVLPYEIIKDEYHMMGACNADICDSCKKLLYDKLSSVPHYIRTVRKLTRAR